MEDKQGSYVLYNIHFINTVYFPSLIIGSDVGFERWPTTLNSITCFPTGRGAKNRLYPSDIPLDVPGGPKSNNPLTASDGTVTL